MARITPDGSVRDDQKAVRSAMRALTERGQAVVDLLCRFEQDAFVDRARLYEIANGHILTFITFSCLGTYTGREELKPSLDDSYFFRSRRKIARMEELCAALRATGVEVQCIVFLPDLEPRRTWGWGVDQEEITLTCTCMVEEATLPEGWEVQLWSHLESDCGAPDDFAAWCAWATETQSLMIDAVDRHLRQFPVIHFPNGTRDAAIRQIAAYAREGSLLERALPNAILVQSEAPIARKDRMFQLRRTNPLPIIHPFI